MIINMQAILVKITGFILSFFSIFTMFSTPFFPPLADFVPPPVDPVVNEGPFMTVVENGATDYRIVIADNPAATVVSAARVLAETIAQATGVTIPTVVAGSYTAGKKIVVSNTAADIDFIDGNPAAIDAALGKEGFLIRTNAGNIYIIGGNRGVIYGAYGFLEKFAGCHWYAVSCVIVPETVKLEVPVDIDVQEVPLIGYRETDWLSPRDPEYCVANRINGNRRYIYDSMGGNEGYTEGFCHTFAQRLPKEKFWDTDREIYAISNFDGERSAEQLCLTNPRTIELMCLEIDRIMADHPNANLISLTQNDGGVYCVCPECKALDEAEGSQSGTMISFVNAVADYTRDKYPDLMLDTFAYYYTRTPPKTVKPRDNVVVRLCSYECCFAHPISDPDCPRNAQFAADLKTWGSISKNVSIWDYTTNYSHLNGPFPNFGVLQANVQYFVENNTVGIYEEGNYMAHESNSEFADLRAYLLARLMWDPYLDYDAEMDGFLQAYYGDGWQYIREYIDMTTAKTGNHDLHTNIGTEMDDRALLNLKPNEIDYINNLWAKAKETAQNDYYRNNVRRSEISWRYWKANNRFSEYSIAGNPFGWYGENKQLYEDFKEFGIIRIRERRLMAENPVLLLPPKQWVP
jgi:hypothetical protein